MKRGEDRPERWARKMRRENGNRKRTTIRVYKRGIGRGHQRERRKMRKRQRVRDSQRQEEKV